MDTIQREKNHILKRGQAAIRAFSFLILAAFGISVCLAQLLSRIPAMWTFGGVCIVLPSCLLMCLIIGFGITKFGPYMQRTEGRKQHWLNEYGQQIQAVVSKHPEENALVIGRLVRGRDASYARYLHWQDPQTNLLYAFAFSTRFSLVLRNLPEGTLYPVQFDPTDLAFFVVPGK